MFVGEDRLCQGIQTRLGRTYSVGEFCDSYMIVREIKPVGEINPVEEINLVGERVTKRLRLWSEIIPCKETL